MINLEKSCFTPTQTLDFLGFVVNARDMTLHLPDSKVESIKRLCFNMIPKSEVSVRELSQLIGKLTASIQAIFPAQLHYRHLQHVKHLALAKEKHYDAPVALSLEAKEELQWWLAHLNAWNGRAILNPSPELFIETDASKMGWGAVRQGITTGVLCSKELFKGSIMCPCMVHVRLRMDNTSAVAYVDGRIP